MSANGSDLRRGQWRQGVDEKGRPEQVEDHSGRDGHGRITPGGDKDRERRR